MAYLDNSPPRADPKALAATLAIHGAMGAILISGLAVTGVIPPPKLPFTGEIIEVPITPPPPTKPDEVQPTPKVPPRSVIFIPEPPFPPDDSVNPKFAKSEPMDNGGGLTATSSSGFDDVVIELPKVTPTPTASPTMKPTRPIPRGEPGSWVTTQDYRSRWVNEGLTGTARFRLSISAQGRVTGCEITRSTGYGALDSATCSLIQRRARFTPSKDGAGNPVAGTYENAVVWRLPD